MPEAATISVREAESQLARFRADFQSLRQEFLEDGEIDREEQEILKVVESMIATIDARVAERKSGSDGIETVAPGGAGPSASSISGSVGKGGKNKADDVAIVQQLLNENGASLEVDGVVGPKTIGAISKFQQSELGFQDGRVDPGGQTWGALTGGGAASGERPTVDGGADGGSDSAPDEDAPEARGDGDGDGTSDVPEIPEDEERRITRQVEERIPDEVPVVVVNENDDVLASPEFPFVLNQEISVGCPFGEIKIKFNDRGQIESAAVAKPIIPGTTVAAGAYGVLAKIEAKPYTGELKLSKQGGNLKLEFELSASGSGMMGLGAGKGDAWAGIGIDIEVKVSRTEKITAVLALETLKQLAMSPTPLPGTQVAFSLPAEIVLSGQQSLVIGGSAKKGVASAASKIVLKDYNPMATLSVTEANGTLDCEFKTYDGLTQMAEDVSRQMVPIVDMVFRAMELAEELDRLMDDPDAYMEEKRREAEDLRRRLLALPDDLSDFVDEELKKLDKLEKEIGEQLDEWGEDIEEAYDDAKEAVEETLEEAEKAIDEASEALEDVYNEAKAAVDESLEDVEEAIEEAGNALEGAYDEAREAVDAKLQEAEEVLDEAEEAIEEAYDDARDAIDETIEDAEEALDDVEDALDDAYDEAKKAYDNPGDYAEEKAGEALDAVSDWFSDDDD
jgi:ElaB/YqjD/DUF883 family membrane-anchored ribosome-binding protein